MSDVFTPAPAELGLRGEEILTWWMEKYGVGAEGRDGAIGTLIMFTKGQGQPPTELFTAFPDLAVSYYTALGGSATPPHSSLPSEPKAAE